MAAVVSVNIITVAVVALLSCLSVGVLAGDYPIKEGRHNLTEGTRMFNDVLLFQDNPSIEGKSFPYPRTQSYDVCYPKKDSQEKVQITHFTVIDKDAGGYAFKHKDSNENRTCFHLKTERGKGYNFDIKIYGHKKH